MAAHLLLTYTYFFNVLARERRAKSRSKLKLSVQLKRERCLIVTAVMLVPDLIHDPVGENKPYMRGSRKFCQRGPDFFVDEGIDNPNTTINGP